MNVSVTEAVLIILLILILIGLIVGFPVVG